MPRTRRAWLLSAVLAAVVVAVGHSALAATDGTGVVVRWSVAASIATTMVVLAPRGHARVLVVLTGVLFLLAGLTAGRGVTFSATLAAANVAECLVVVWWLTRDTTGRPRLRSWHDYQRWLIGCALGSAVGGLLGVLPLLVIDVEHPWRACLWIGLTHFSTESVLLSLALSSAERVARPRPSEVASQLALLVVGAAVCLRAEADEPVAFLLLPLLVWAAARFAQRWATVELLVVAAGLSWLTAHDAGPFRDLTGEMGLLGIVSSVQAFLSISAITTLAFTVAMAHLRDSLRTIRTNEVQLAQLLDSASGTAFIATDLDGLITWFSPGAELMLGYSAQELVGRATPARFHDGCELAARAEELATEPGHRVLTWALDRGAEQESRDWTYVRRDGSRLTVSLSTTAVRDEDGRPVSFLHIVRDVTDRRAAEQALVFALDRERDTNEQMRELDRAKTEFVSSVSHELRTPLTSIVGYTELLSDPDVADNLTEVQRQLVERIDRNGERLLALVEDLLTLARVEDGSFALERTPTDLRQAVRRATEEATPGAHQGRVRVDLRLPEEEVRVEGDPEHLRRLALNLVSNAVKFTPPGGHVDVELTTDGALAELVVRDTGMGIPLEEQSMLFQRFFRSTLANERAIQGTGLGLCIVRAIADAHGGTVDFESTPGAGTTFRFCVPRVVPAATELVVPAGEPVATVPPAAEHHLPAHP